MSYRYIDTVKSKSLSLKNEVGLALSLEECEEIVIDIISHILSNQKGYKYQFIGRNKKGKIEKVAFYEYDTSHRVHIKAADRDNLTYEITEL